MRARWQKKIVEARKQKQIGTINEFKSAVESCADRGAGINTSRGFSRLCVLK